MSDKKYVVPEAMLEAVNSNVEPATWIDDALILAIILAAIRWLAENPIVPTQDDIESMILDIERQRGESFSHTLLPVEWQRRMFLAPEPEVPDAVKDLLAPFAADGFPAMLAKSSIIEAYNRGKAGK